MMQLKGQLIRNFIKKEIQLEYNKSLDLNVIAIGLDCITLYNSALFLSYPWLRLPTLLIQHKQSEAFQCLAPSVRTDND